MNIQTFAKENYEIGGYYGVCRVMNGDKRLYDLKTDCTTFLRYEDAENAAIGLKADLLNI